VPGEFDADFRGANHSAANLREERECREQWVGKTSF